LRLSNYCADERPFAESYSRGWAYSTVLPSRELIVYLFTAPAAQPIGKLSGTPAFLLKELANCPVAASRVLKAETPHPSDVSFFATDASSTRSRPVAGSGWSLVGDCAQTMDPLSSSGIAQALQHAELISDALLGSRSLRSADLADYVSAADRGYESHVATRRRVYGLEQRWPTPFWDQITGNTLGTIEHQ
jgi:2-polyprenyl-6-methoxyphenol hydroxylase-like FAD-dependent oxidoreductase